MQLFQLSHLVSELIILSSLSVLAMAAPLVPQSNNSTKQWTFDEVKALSSSLQTLIENFFAKYPPRSNPLRASHGIHVSRIIPVLC